MKLAIILFGISLALAYEERYEGFDDCGINGWTCVHDNGKPEIIYTCLQKNPRARVWVWTARLPAGTSVFTVRDCVHLEVHIDCTKGIRSYTSIHQMEFRVINVTHLEILPPLKPGVFLHDNDQVPQAPPVFHVSNVKKINLYPGMFDRPGGGCRYKFMKLNSLILENVHVDRIMKDLFHNQSLSTFVMKNVTIDAIDSNAMSIDANATITGSSFPFIPVNAISLRGESIIFKNNTFKKIQTNALSVKSKEFIFSNNHVDEINTQGLDVLGTKTEITNNVFNHLETGALQSITPGYSAFTYGIATRFIYNFSNNLIKNINPGSIHLNWEVTKKVCSDIIFKNNVVDCSCINLGWLSVSNGLGPKISKAKEFYDIYLTKDDNSCNGHNNCPLKAVVEQIQDVCNNKTNVSTICSSFGSTTDAVTVALSDELTIAMRETTEEENFLTERTEVSEKIIPVLSYTENQTYHVETTGIPLWFTVIPVIVILAAVSIGIFMWWYKKKKQRQMIMTVYKNERGADADNLIVINEHHNELYDKQ